jgi:hypothetical protein
MVPAPTAVASISLLSERGRVAVGTRITPRTELPLRHAIDAGGCGRWTIFQRRSWVRHPMLKAGSGGSATATDRYTRHVRTHSEHPPSAPRAVPISRSNPTRPNAILRQRRRECVQRRLARREDDPSRLASERTEAARTLPSEYVVVDPDHVERDLIASGTHSAASFRRSGAFASSRR